MVRQEFDTVNVVRLEVETDPTGLANLVQNPSGELGGWGWITTLSDSAMSGIAGPLLQYERTVAGASSFTTEALPIAAGQYAAARWEAVAASGAAYMRARFEWLDAAGALLSSSAQTGYVSTTTTVGQMSPVVAPASTAFVRLRFDVYLTNAGANPSGSHWVKLHQVTVAKSATSGALGTLRINLAPNPSFETDVSGWRAGFTSTVARSTAQAAVGSASLLFTAGSKINDRWLSTVGGTGGMPVSSGGTYTLQFRSRAATIGRSINVRPLWFNASGVAVAGGSDTVVGPTSTSGWTTFNVTVTAPIGAAFFGFSLYPSGVAAGEQHYFDAFHVEAGSSIASYFDGSTPNAGGITYGWANHAAVVKARTNLVTNPSFETNTTGWEGNGGSAIARVTSPAGVFGSACLQVTGGGGVQQTLAAKMPVTAGLPYRATVYARAASTERTYPVYIQWLNASGSTISTSEPLWWPTAVTTGWIRGESSTAAVAPSGATHARLIIGLGDAGEVRYIDAVLFEQSDWTRAYFDGSTGGTPDSWIATSSRAWSGTAHASTSTQTDTSTMPYSTAASTNLAYIEPVPYLNILGESQNVRVSREQLNAGALSAVIRSRSLDPSQSPLLRPGRRARLTALIGGVWETIIGGKLLEADVTYEVKDPQVPTEKQARIEVVLVDPTQPLANAGRPEGVATIDELPFVLEGAGVPWNVNGSGNQVPAANVTTYNETAKALDQVALTRDTVIGYAWMSRLGVLNVWDRDQIASGAPILLDEDDYSDIDLSFSTKDVINEVQITVQSLGADGTTTETVYGPYTDDASIQQWGRYRKEFTVTGLDSAAVDALAAAIIAAAATPRIRVNSIAIPLHTIARMESRALLDLYDEVRVVVTALGVDDTLRVRGLVHVIETEKWMLRLDFADEGGVAVPTVQPPVQSGIRPDVGVIELFAGATPPAGKLLCDGSSHAVADYPYLFAVIGYTFGGAGAFFNVPNLTDRFPIGSGTKALGTTGGAASRTLTSANIPTVSLTATGSASGGGSENGGVSVAQGGTTGRFNHPVQTNGGAATQAVDILNPWLSLNFVIRAA